MFKYKYYVCKINLLDFVMRHQTLITERGTILMVHAEADKIAIGN